MATKRAPGYDHLTDKQYKMLGGASVHHTAPAKSSALKKRTGKADHSWLDKHVEEQAKRHGPVVSKLIKDVSR